MAQRKDIGAAMNRLPDIGRFRDYGPNGRQVEGRDEGRRPVCGVTASGLEQAGVEVGVPA